MPDGTEQVFAVTDIALRVASKIVVDCLSVEENGWETVHQILMWLNENQSPLRAGKLVKSFFHCLIREFMRSKLDFEKAHGSCLLTNIVAVSFLFEEAIISDRSMFEKQLFFAREQSTESNLVDLLFKLLEFIEPRASSSKRKRSFEEECSKISGSVERTYSEKLQSELSKRNYFATATDESKRKQRDLLRKHMNSLSADGPWCTVSKFTLVPFPQLDSSLARPLLKVQITDIDIPSLSPQPSSLVNEYDLTQIPSDIIVGPPESSEDCEEDELPDPADDKATATLHPLKSSVSCEKSAFSAEVAWIFPLTAKYGTLQIIQSSSVPLLKFTFDSSQTSQFSTKVELFEYKHSESKPYTKEWEVSHVVRIIPKTYVMRHRAIELFLDDGRSLLFNFASAQERKSFISHIRRLKKGIIPRVLSAAKPHLMKFLNENEMTEKWVNWEISNFEYLMFLNICAGRSYNDLTQYPVFPWVLTDYTSPVLDLSNSGVYRDFSKNMGTLGSTLRTKRFIERFDMLKYEREIPPFHYGSHYSNPGIVMHFLIRQPPYSEGAQELQGGHYDIPDRLFSGIIPAFISATDDVSDVRELIPEFFVNPEFLINREKFEFGVTQTGKKVGDVELPQWAADAYEFIRIHRLALESDWVSGHLNEWIDLVFGYQQIGPEAEQAVNVFHYITYENYIDLDKIEDPNIRNSLETQVVHFGKTPSQLFRKPHAVRQIRENISPGPTVFCEDAQVKTYVVPSGNGKKEGGIDIVKMKFVSEKEIVAVRRNGNVLKCAWWPTPTGDTATPFNFKVKTEISSEKLYKGSPFSRHDREYVNWNSPIGIINKGTTIISGGYWDGSIACASVGNTFYIHYHRATVTCLDITENEKYAVTGSKDGKIVCWVVGADKLTPLHSHFDHEQAVTSVEINTELSVYASCSLDGKCKIYSISKGNLLRSIYVPQSSPIEMLRISPAPPASIVLHVFPRHSLLSYSINGEFLYETPEESSHILSPVIRRNLNFQEFLVYGTDTGFVTIRNSTTLELIRRFSHQFPIPAVLITPELRFLIYTCSRGDFTIITDPHATFQMLKKQWDIGSVFQLL